jgi:hypothetical protein
LYDYKSTELFIICEVYLRNRSRKKTVLSPSTLKAGKHSPEAI